MDPASERVLALHEDLLELGHGGVRQVVAKRLQRRLLRVRAAANQQPSLQTGLGANIITFDLLHVKAGGRP